MPEEEALAEMELVEEAVKRLRREGKGIFLSS